MCYGNRLTTFEVVFPRCVLAEFNTHRYFSRNSASSRAIPVKKMIERVLNNGYVPWHWGKNQKGMQAENQVTEADANISKIIWKMATQQAVNSATFLGDVGIHKQITNRLLEPFMLHTVIVTATHYGNFFNQRCHPDAHPDIRMVALLMRELYEQGTPASLVPGEYHLPLVSEDELAEFSIEDLIKISAGRCARVSYLTHDGRRDVSADIELAERLVLSGHMSPLEHIARPVERDDLPNGMIRIGDAQNTKGFQLKPSDVWFGNFKGFVQHRKTLPNEDDILDGLQIT